MIETRTNPITTEQTDPFEDETVCVPLRYFEGLLRQLERLSMAFRQYEDLQKKYSGLEEELVNAKNNSEELHSSVEDYKKAAEYWAAEYRKLTQNEEA